VAQGVKGMRYRRKYLASNALSLVGKQMREIYKLRQGVEEAFRCLKQELGWTGLKHRSSQILEQHLALSLTAYAIIELERHKTKHSFYQFRRGLISGRIPVPNLVCDSFPLAA